MAVELVLGLGLTFVIIVAGSYVGAKMALNTFFGRDFSPAESDQFDSSESTSDDKD